MIHAHHEEAGTAECLGEVVARDDARKAMHEQHGRQRTFIDLTGHIDLAIQLGTLYEDVQCVNIGNSLRGIGTVVRIPKQIVSILIHKKIPFYTFSGARLYQSLP